MKLSFNKTLYIDFVVMLALAIISAVVSYVTFNRHIKQTHLLEHTYSVINETQNLQNLLLDMESSRRGYWNTGNKKYLGNYQDAKPQIHPAIEKIKSLLADSEDLYRGIAILQSKIDVLLKFWENSEGDISVSPGGDSIDDEKIKTDDIDLSLTLLREAETRTLLQKNEEEATAINYAYWASLAGTTLMIIIVLTLIYYVLKEINKRNILENELENSLIKEKELNEIKSLFVSMASHEFRAPLSVILSSASLISKYTDTEQQTNRDKHIRRIAGSVTFLTQIMNNFLSLGKIESGEINVNNSDIEINFQMTEFTDEVKHLLKNGQEIEFTHNGISNSVYLDSNLLRHVITNLLTNAIKYSPENSKIQLTSILKKESFEIIVKDNGIGIPKEEQDKLFSKFFRSSNAANIQGTGLGLHIVEKYTHLMGGKIICESEPGKGTSFILNFPMS